MTGVNRLGVLRASGLGDLIQSLPAFEALRAAYPMAEIVLVGGPVHEVLLEERPGPIDRVIALPEGAIGFTGRALSHSREAAPVEGTPPGLRPADIVDALRAERFDLALQLFGGGQESNAIVHALGARVSAGSWEVGAPQLDRMVRYVHYQSESLRALEIVGLVGAPPVVLEPHVELTSRDDVAAASVLPDDGHPLAILHPGASDPRRRWPPDRFALVGDALAERGLRVAFTGTGGDEAAIVTDAISAMRHEGLDLVDRLSIPALIGLLARARIVVANDTGPLHLAAAVGTPSVGIYWFGNLLTGGPTFRSRSRAVTGWRPTCPVCGADNAETRGCEHRVSFVSDVPPARVVELAADLLDGR